MHELSLVFFTVLAQSTVGLFLVLATMLLFNRSPERKRVLSRFMGLVLVMLGISGALAMTHLGQPLRAFNVIFGLEHFSRLSIEIITTGTFGGAVFVYGAMAHFGILEKLQKLVLVAAMGLGFALLLAIANVYTLDTVPAWNSDWTVLQFVLTAFVVGLPATALVLRAGAGGLGIYQKNTDRALATLSFIVLGVTLTAYPLYLFWLGQLDASLLGRFDYHTGLVLARTALLFVGLGCWIISATRGNNNGVVLAAVSTVLVLIAELCGRIFFYDMHALAL